MAKVLVTGATGFIGKRLAYKLLEDGHEVYSLSRVKGVPLNLGDHPHSHLVYGDMRDPHAVNPFPQEIEVAYYLVHSMSKVVSDLIEEETLVARQFLSWLEQTNCRQIIYLGGIIEDEKSLSPHLRSRLAVEKVLKSGKIPCTILRSSIIIGSGSASFEIIRDLAEKLPLMVAPKWVKNFCQPIAIRDVLFYLMGILLNSASFGNTYDIGGPEVISFRDVLLRYARLRHLKLYILNVPFFTPKLSSYWLILITSVPYSLCRHLVESMRQHTRKLNGAIDQLLPHRCISYEEAISLAFQKIAQNEVISTWMDAWEVDRVGADIQDFIQVPEEGCLRDVKRVPITVPIEEAVRRVWSIGGVRGWYSMNWSWRLRGFIDQLIGGRGLNRGRRDPNQLQVGDSVDFWRVILANQKKKHLILYAEMKLPGEAWLEFAIDEKKKILTQTATFRPKGIWGRLYWYSMFLFHSIIFKNMAKGIASDDSTMYKQR